MSKFQLTWHNASLSIGNWNLFKSRAIPFFQGEIYVHIIAKCWKLYIDYIWIFFSRTTGPISVKLSWHKAFNFFPNEGPYLCPRWDDINIVNIQGRFLKIFSLKRKKKPNTNNTVNGILGKHSSNRSSLNQIHLKKTKYPPVFF